MICIDLVSADEEDVVKKDSSPTTSSSSNSTSSSYSDTDIFDDDVYLSTKKKVNTKVKRSKINFILNPDLKFSTHVEWKKWANSHRWHYYNHAREFANIDGGNSIYSEYIYKCKLHLNCRAEVEFNYIVTEPSHWTVGFRYDHASIVAPYAG
jgi:hypothetical protein